MGTIQHGDDVKDTKVFAQRSARKQLDWLIVDDFPANKLLIKDSVSTKFSTA